MAEDRDDEGGRAEVEADAVDPEEPSRLAPPASGVEAPFKDDADAISPPAVVENSVMVCVDGEERNETDRLAG